MIYVFALALMVQVTWTQAVVILSLARMLSADRAHKVFAAARFLFHELRPFYLPAVVVGIAHDTFTGDMTGWRGFFAGLALLNWWLLKDIDEDDRWKRRKAKLVEKVERRGARLVAVPVGGGAS